MASEDFQRFVETFTHTDAEAAQEGCDTAALERLQGSEREQAEQILIARLGHDDSRAALGLGVLRSKAAAARIRDLMLETEGIEREVDAEALINNSLAVYLIEGDKRALTNITNVLEVAPIESNRIAAVLALRDTGAPEAEPALWRAVEEDESGLVRHNAAKALLMMHGKHKDPRESPPVTIRLMVKAPHVRLEALRELKEMLREP